ncbi:MOSC domain-containing protein [Mariannaea sp. PMI_226]|nr:MOSC domain-containing protein [Mariannaea sp. PMI_226]
MIAPDTDMFSRPFGVDKLLEIRTSRMKKMAGIEVLSGIDKTLCPGPMKIDKLGLEGDEHDLTFHGGPDKAILGYCSSHYRDWQAAFPERTGQFVPGGFGENFVTAAMNERNVCIGDIISVGPEVLLQVSLPRQPCFKLNHRFSLKNFAPLTYQTSRTGWYYRVIREGTVDVGDEIKLVERKWPKWTIERIQEYLHRNTTNLAMNEELSQIEALGEESRGQFRNRVAKAQRKKRDEAAWKDFQIISRKMETPKIVSLTLKAVIPDPEADEFPLGAHARLKLPNGLIRSYSVVSSGKDDDGNEGNVFELGIALDDESRGGSRYLHESVKVGDIMQVGRITADVAFGGSASMHVLITGGIGITAFLALIEVYEAINFAFHLHYAVRSAEHIPFRDRLEPLKKHMTIYDKSKGERMDIQNIVKTMPWNSHLYVCGPTRMMEAAKEAADENCIPPGEVHYEAFAADISGDPFEAEVVNKGNKLVKVGEDESLLDALRREFGDFPSSCEVGNCGTCKITLKSGSVDHRGVALLPEEKETAMLACVSRGLGKIAIEI